MDQTHTIMPGSVNGPHLVECPHCHASNGLTAVRCWSCDRVLPPELTAVSASDLSSESAWPSDAFKGVSLDGPSPVDDAAPAANTAAFDAPGTSTEFPQTSRSERRARLASAASSASSVRMPSSLFEADKAQPAPISVDEALTQAGMSSGDEADRLPPQSSTLDEQAKAAIPAWKPEPWKPSVAEPEASDASPAESVPTEFFPEFAPLRASPTAAAAGESAVRAATDSPVKTPPASAARAAVPPPQPPERPRIEPSPRRMTPEEIAATFRAPIRRHPWQDPKWLGAGAAALALIVGLGVYFYPRTVDESDWTPASTRGLVEQRGSQRNPQAILDGQSPEVTSAPATDPALSSTPAPSARDPQAILNGEPTSAGAETTSTATSTSTDEAPVAATPATRDSARSRAAASAAIDALLSSPSTPGPRPGGARGAAANSGPTASTTAPVAPETPAIEPAITTGQAPLSGTGASIPGGAAAVTTTTPTPTPTASTRGCTPTLQALALCGPP